MRTSHVGSFPLDPSPQSLRRVMVDLYKIGLDVPAYPQMRSFIEIYAKPLEEAGVVSSRKGLKILASSERLSEIRRLRPIISEAFDTFKVVKAEGLRFKDLRAPVTGPFTLASRIYVKTPSSGLFGTLLPERDLLIDYVVPYLRNIVLWLKDIGYTVICIDEPILGMIVGRKKALFYSEDDILEVFNKLLSGITGYNGTHICGRVSDKLFNMLTRSEVIRFLNLEFHDTPQNLEIISRNALENGDKVIAPGVVSSKSLNIEGVKEVKDLLKKLYEITGGRLDLISPDCGFGALRGLSDEKTTYEAIIAKLKNMVTAVRLFG